MSGPKLRRPTPKPLDAPAPTHTTEASAETAIDRLEAGRAAAIAAVADLTARRAALLADDGLDDEVEALDVEIARNRRQIERAEAAAPSLRAKAEAERRERIEADFVAGHAEYREAVETLLVAYRASVEACHRVAEIVNSLTLRFAGRAGAFVAFPVADLTLEPERLAAFAAEVERASAAEARRLEGDW